MKTAKHLITLTEFDFENGTIPFSLLTKLASQLLAQKYAPEEAAILGVYLHGLAGDYAADQYGEWSMRATDLINKLGNAFAEINCKFSE